MLPGIDAVIEVTCGLRVAAEQVDDVRSGMEHDVQHAVDDGGGRIDREKIQLQPGMDGGVRSEVQDPGVTVQGRGRLGATQEDAVALRQRRQRLRDN